MENGLTKYDRESELLRFDESKAGVKGLMDAGIVEVPPMFVHGDYKLEYEGDNNRVGDFPVIDFTGVDDGKRDEIAGLVGAACETYGVFQVVNHGIPISMLNEVVEAIRGFHEGDVEMKKKYYGRDFGSGKNVYYHSNHDLFLAKAVCWRDTLTLIREYSASNNAQELPPICRDIMVKYTDELNKLGETIYGLLSKALGLEGNYLKEQGCGDAIFMPCHYYPACPQPELTLGAVAHVDSGFITILLQDQSGGLQVYYDDHWLDVAPISGALVVNIGNLLQLMINDKLKSPYHRVVAKREGRRVSVAGIFRAHHFPGNTKRLYGPTKQLLPEDNPPRYREITVKDMVFHKHSPQMRKIANALHPFKLSSALSK